MTDEVKKSFSPLVDDIAAMAFVQSSTLCQGVDEILLGQLVEHGTVGDVAVGGTVFAEGTVDDGLYMIVEGKVSVRKRRGDEEIELATLERQAILGEIGVLMERAQIASVIATVPTRLVRIEGAAVRAVAEAAPKFGRKLAALMAGRSRVTQEKLG